VLRSPLALRASFRDHPSDSSFRLFDCPFVRFCFPIDLRLAPSSNRSASPSALHAACTAGRASSSAVLSVDRLAPLEPNLPASSSAASSACTAERASDICCPAGPFDLRLPTDLPASPSIAPSACAFGWISGSASRLLSGLRLLPTVPPHLPRCSSACAVSLASGSAFLPAYFQLAPNCGPFSPRLPLCRSACALN